MQFDGSKAWLQEHVPVKFWEMCEDMWVQQIRKYRAEAKNNIEHLGLSSSKSLLKLVSYWGAVSVPKWATKWTSPEYPGFADVWVSCLRKGIPPGVARLPIRRPCYLQRLHGR